MHYLNFQIAATEPSFLRRVTEHQILNAGYVERWLEAVPLPGSFYLRNVNYQGKLLSFHFEAPTPVHIEQSLTLLKDVVLFAHYFVSPQGLWSIFVDKTHVQPWVKQPSSRYWISPPSDILQAVDLTHYLSLRALCGMPAPPQQIAQPPPPSPLPPGLLLPKKG